VAKNHFENPNKPSFFAPAFERKTSSSNKTKSKCEKVHNATKKMLKYLEYGSKRYYLCSPFV
jgi:hypothetical protein